MIALKRIKPVKQHPLRIFGEQKGKRYRDVNIEKITGRVSIYPEYSQCKNNRLIDRREQTT